MSIESLLDQFGLSMEVIGKPQPKIDDWLRVEYQVRLLKNGECILNAPYSMGLGHFPLQWENPEDGRLHLQPKEQAVYYTLKKNPQANIREDYRQYHASLSAKIAVASGIEPSLKDVVYALITDSSVRQHESFEDWASDYGYDVDSRKAEKIYKDCQKNASALVHGLGEEILGQLEEAFQDY